MHCVAVRTISCASPISPRSCYAPWITRSQRKRLERTNALISARLERSERLHRYLVDHSPDIIYTVDEEGRFTYLNPTVATVLGRGTTELIGQHYSAIVHEDDMERARYAFGERRTGERASRNIELRLRRTNGEA